MPIKDYEANAKKDQINFFAIETISEKNKQAVQKYLAQYNVKPATKSKFFKHIRFLLEKLPDIEKQMHDRELINKTFHQFRETLSPGYIGTLINVSKAFIRWINDGELPKGFKDIKGISKKEGRRALRPEDMWTWEDGLKLAKQTPSLQIKAIILTQIDAGLRPSEFIDLNYGDVIIHPNGLISLQVREGKTGSRVVPCHRCAPILVQWYENHPTQKKTDPLWIKEFAEKSPPKQKKQTPPQCNIRRYEYASLKKRIKDLAHKAGLKKPCDFYTLRHSSCTLDKIDNVPLETATSRHGHTVQYFTEIYGRLDIEDVANRLYAHYGGKVKDQHKSKPNIVCDRCTRINEPSAQVCVKCGWPFSVKKAMELEQEHQHKLTELQQQLKTKELEHYFTEFLIKKGIWKNK